MFESGKGRTLRRAVFIGNFLILSDPLPLGSWVLLSCRDFRPAPSCQGVVAWGGIGQFNRRGKIQSKMFCLGPVLNIHLREYIR